MAGFPEGGESGFVRLFALSAEGLRMGAWWQPLTYAVLHGSWAHLLANVFGLAVTGACLEHVLGARRLMGVVAVGAAFGAVGFLASLALDARLSGGASCVGASACLAACLGAVTGLAPRARVTLFSMQKTPLFSRISEVMTAQVPQRAAMSLASERI